jgi:hypothetical protein
VGPNAPRRIALSALALALTFGTTVLAFSAAPAGAKNLPLKPLLLTVNELPTGWTVGHSSTLSGCGQPKGVKVIQDVSASFSDGGNLQLAEQFKVYSIAVDAAYRKVLVPLDRCTHEKLVEGGKSLTASFGQMSLRRFGNQSEAFDARVDRKGATTNIYEVVIRSGNIIVTITERGTDLGRLENFTKLALSKLPFGGTVPASATSTTTTIAPTTTTTSTVPPTTTTTKPPPTTTTRPPPPTTTSTAPHAPPATTPPTTGCYIDPEGNCYRAGEYCPGSLHGQTVQGENGPIICEDNNGWRWEPA